MWRRSRLLGSLRRGRWNQGWRGSLRQVGYMLLYLRDQGSAGVWMGIFWREKSFPFTRRPSGSRDGVLLPSLWLGSENSKSLQPYDPNVLTCMYFTELISGLIVIIIHHWCFQRWSRFSQIILPSYIDIKIYSPFNVSYSSVSAGIPLVLQLLFPLRLFFHSLIKSHERRTTLKDTTQHPRPP